MKRFHLLLVTLVFTLVILVGLLVNDAGYVSVRRVQPKRSTELVIVEPLVPGVPTVIRWDAGNDTFADVALEVRTRSTTDFLGTVSFHEQRLASKVSCSIGDQEASIVMTSTQTQELIAWLPVRILPAGRDCYEATRVSK